MQRSAFCFRPSFAILTVAGLLAGGCGDDTTEASGDSGDVNISGSQGGDASAGGGATQASTGEWVDAGDNIRIAILGHKVAGEAGGMMMKDDQRAVAVRLQIANTGDSIAQPGLKPVKLVAGGEQHGMGMGSAAAMVAFQDDDISALPSVTKLLPGQVIEGWTSFAPADGSTDDMAVLIGKGGNPMRALDDNQVAARIKLGSPSDGSPLGTESSLKATHALGDTLTGGASDVTVLSAGRAENAKQVEEGNVVYVADVRLTNKLDKTSKVNDLVSVGSMVYLIDGEGHVYQPGMVGMLVDLPRIEAESNSPDDQMKAILNNGMRMASWPQEIEAGQTVEGKVAFEVPEGTTGLMLAIDSGLGYSVIREFAKVAETPVGVWPVE